MSKIRIPGEEELKERITSQLSSGGNNKDINVMWSGYIAGLHEWGVISTSTFSELLSILTTDGCDAVSEAMAGFYEEDDDSR